MGSEANVAQRIGVNLRCISLIIPESWRRVFSVLKSVNALELSANDDA